MDRCAELTLQIARLVHERPDPPRSPAYWGFLLGRPRLTWPEVRSILADAPKPLLLAPLVEPGSLALWTADEMNEKDRALLMGEIANQVQYFAEKLQLCGVGDDGVIHFEPATPRLSLTVPEFRRWTREYAVSVGVSLTTAAEPGAARLVVRPPGGGAPPLGAEPRTAVGERAPPRSDIVQFACGRP